MIKIIILYGLYSHSENLKKYTESPLKNGNSHMLVKTPPNELLVEAQFLLLLHGEILHLLVILNSLHVFAVVLLILLVK